jgi:hypothetical protein
MLDFINDNKYNYNDRQCKGLVIFFAFMSLSPCGQNILPRRHYGT